MTQGNDSATGSGTAPDAAMPAKKTRATTKKTVPAKPAAKKPAAKTTPSAGETQKTASKPRAAAKAAPDGAATKAPAKPRAAAKPKAAPEEKAAHSPPSETPAEKKPAAKAKTAPAKTAKKSLKTEKAEAPAGPETPEAAESTAAKPAGKKQSRAPRTAQTGDHLTDTASQPSQPVAAPSVPTPAVPTRAETPQAAPLAVPQVPETDRQDARTEAATGHAEGETAQTSKPASRRSRRGGRRRNKAKAAAAERESGMTAAVETDATGESGEPVVPDAGEDKARDTRDAKAEQKGASQKSGKGGKKDASRPESQRRSSKDALADEPESVASGKRTMFISVLSGELVEVVLAEEGHIVEYYVEMQHQAKVKGNIYKGVVSNIDANLQAAFISYAGGVKNGFLQIDEVHPEYYLAHHDPAKGRKYPPIQKVLKPGQEILVQVVKEPAGTKGAFLTSYLSLPGRFLVLTPGREQIGVSRKVDSDEERGRLRSMLEGLKPGPGLGVIVRTVSTGASKTSMQRDLQFLKRLWKDVRTKGQTAPTPSLVYEELDLSTRAVRDYLTEEVQEVWVDDDATAAQVAELATLLFPKKKDMVQVHHDNGQSLFERFSLQKQLDQIHSREVSLPSGGSLVIDKTEALTAIDINSGRSSGKSNFEDMAYRTNMEAARAIPLQLRLRDIGGQIVADFIEMRDRDHWREVEKAVRSGMKGDRARYDVGKIGPFGMLEIVRQRLGSSAISISTEPCPCCKGTGIRRNMEWQAMQSLREIGRKLRQAGANNQSSLTWNAEPELAFYLLNAKRSLLQSLESESGVVLVIAPKTE